MELARASLVVLRAKSVYRIVLSVPAVYAGIFPLRASRGAQGVRRLLARIQRKPAGIAVGRATGVLLDFLRGACRTLFPAVFPERDGI